MCLLEFLGYCVWMIWCTWQYAAVLIAIEVTSKKASMLLQGFVVISSYLCSWDIFVSLGEKTWIGSCKIKFVHCLQGFIMGTFPIKWFLKFVLFTNIFLNFINLIPTFWPTGSKLGHFISLVWSRTWISEPGNCE